MSDQELSTELKLVEANSSTNMDQLADEILQRRRNDLTINIDGVERIDTPAIEILLSAAKLWREESCKLGIVGNSEAFDSALAILGIPRTELEVGA